MHITYASCSIG